MWHTIHYVFTSSKIINWMVTHGWLWWRLMIVQLRIKEKSFSQFSTYSHCLKKKKILPGFPSFFSPRVSASQKTLGVWPQGHMAPHVISCYFWVSFGDGALLLEVWIRGRESKAWVKLVAFYQVDTKLLKAHLLFSFLPVYWKYSQAMYFFMSFCFDNSVFVLLHSKYF